MNDFLKRCLTAYQQFDVSKKAQVARYAANRFIDVFVIGPAAIAVMFCFGVWAMGESPLRYVAEQMKEQGEAFRAAPAGYVSVVQYPERKTVSELPQPPLTDSEKDALPHKLVPVSVWTNELAESLGRWYITGVSLGLMFVVLLRGWSILVSPFKSAKGVANG